MAAFVKKTNAPVEVLKTKPLFTWPKPQKGQGYDYPVSLKDIRYRPNPVAKCFLSRAKDALKVDCCFLNSANWSDKPTAMKKFNHGDPIMWEYMGSAMSYCSKSEYLSFTMKGEDIEIYLQNSNEVWRANNHTEEGNDALQVDDKFRYTGEGKDAQITHIAGKPFEPTKEYRVGTLGFCAGTLIPKYHPDAKVVVPEEGRSCPSVNVLGFKLAAATAMDFKVFMTLAPEHKDKIKAKQDKVNATAKETQEAMADLKLASSIADAWEVVEEELQCGKFCSAVVNGAMKSKDVCLKVLLAASLVALAIAFVCLALTAYYVVGVPISSYQFHHCIDSNSPTCVIDSDPLVLCPPDLQHEAYNDPETSAAEAYLQCVETLCGSDPGYISCHETPCGNDDEEVTDFYIGDDVPMCTDISGVVPSDDNTGKPWTYLCKLDELTDEEKLTCLGSLCGLESCDQVLCDPECCVLEGTETSCEDADCSVTCQNDICGQMDDETQVDNCLATLFDPDLASEIVDQIFFIQWEIWAIFTAAFIFLSGSMFYNVLVRAQHLKEYYGEQVRREIAAAQAEMKKLAGGDTEPDMPTFDESSVLGYATVQFPKGIALRKDPEFPGKKTGQTVKKGTKVPYSEEAELQFDYKGSTYTVMMYRLATGEGWIHDFNPANPGEPGVMELTDA